MVCDMRRQYKHFDNLLVDEKRDLEKWRSKSGTADLQELQR